MQTVHKLLDLPVPGQGALWARFAYDDVSACVEFRYSDPKKEHAQLGKIRFTHVISFRFGDEMHSRGFYSESYESLAEVVDSEWLSELSATEPRGLLTTELWERHHFAVFLSNCGFFEVIAEDWSFSTEDAAADSIWSWVKM
jgi:hypothetical protein